MPFRCLCYGCPQLARIGAMVKVSSGCRGKRKTREHFLKWSLSSVNLALPNIMNHTKRGHNGGAFRYKTAAARRFCLQCSPISMSHKCIGTSAPCHLCLPARSESPHRNVPHAVGRNTSSLIIIDPRSGLQIPTLPTSLFDPTPPFTILLMTELMSMTSVSYHLQILDISPIGGFA